jgi:hypothetical protein
MGGTLADLDGEAAGRIVYSIRGVFYSCGAAVLSYDEVRRPHLFLHNINLKSSWSAAGSFSGDGLAACVQSESSSVRSAAVRRR